MADGQSRKGGTEFGSRSRPWLRYLVVLCVWGPLYGLSALASHFVLGRPWDRAFLLAIGPMVAVPAYVLWSNRRGRGGREGDARPAVPAKVPPPPQPPPPLDP